MILAGENGGALYLADEGGLPLIYAGPSEKGNALLTVGGYADKEGTLAVYNRKGYPIVTAGPDANSHGGLWVNNKDGSGIVSMTSNGEKGDGFSAIYNRNGKPLFTSAASGESGSLYIYNSEEKYLIYAGASAIGDGMLLVKKGNGLDLISAAADLDGNGQLKVSNRQGNDLIYVGGNNNGNGLIRVLNHKAQLGLVAVAGEQASYLSIENNDKTVAVMASDFNGNGLVETYANNQDRLWSSNFAQQTGPVGQFGLLGDLDGDGDVDGSDVLLMSENYGNKLGKITSQGASFWFCRHFEYQG